MTEKINLSIGIYEQVEANDNLPPQKYIWGGITPGSLGFVYGPPKSGKTTFCENLGMCIAFGQKEYFGHKIDFEEPQKVLFISMEEYWRQRVQRNKKQLDKIEVAEELKSNYKTASINFPRVFLKNDDLKKHLQMIIDEVKPNVVFIDSMTRMATKDIEDSTVCSAISMILRELANENKVAIIVIHHTHKLNGNGISVDSLAGSRVLAQEADFMIGINRTNNGLRYYKEVAMRYGQEKDDVVSFEIDDSQWLQPIQEMAEYKVLELKDRRRKPEKHKPIITTLEEGYKTNTTYTTAELRDRVVKSGAMKQSTFYDQMKTLEHKNIIRTEGNNVLLNP